MLKNGFALIYLQGSHGGHGICCRANGKLKGLGISLGNHGSNVAGEFIGNSEILVGENRLVGKVIRVSIIKHKKLPVHGVLKVFVFAEVRTKDVRKAEVYASTKNIRLRMVVRAP